MEDIFAQLSLIIVIAAAVSLLMRLLRQPLILGYILTGLIVGPSALNLIHSHETFETFSSIGIALLLFIIGLGLNVSVIKKLGAVVFTTTAVELFTVGSLGFLAASLLGFNDVEALIVGLALFFSSTIIIVKMLTDKKEQNRLHGQIAIGVILLDDIVATIALLFVAAGKDSTFDSYEIMSLALKGGLLIAFLAFCSTKILPKLMRFIAGSQELLFLFAIGWGFGVASLFELVGFSIEVGALFAGVALASLTYASEIGARLKPLRDFFVVLFFIVLGESLDITNLSDALIPALILSAIVIFGKPITILATLGMFGYTKRVGFKTAINLSQISEFSIVLVVLAAASGIIDPGISAIITIVAIITIATSTYLVHFDDYLFTKFDKLKFGFFERKVAKRKENLTTTNYPIILFGYQKGGHEFVRTFKKLGNPFIVVDYDPNVIDHLQHNRIPYMYGDASDVELLDEVGAHSAKLIVSTITDFEITKPMVKHVVQHNPKAVIICSADNQEEAVELYDLGCSYVMIPHFIGSEKIGAFVRETNLRKSDFKKIRDQHLRYLEKQPLITSTEKNHDKKNHRKKKIGHAVVDRVASLKPKL